MANVTLTKNNQELVALIEADASVDKNPSSAGAEG